MNDDDMSDDEFDAFLNGTDALSRRLQALPQPSSSAQLDAAILARVQNALAHENRPPAANDAIDNSPKLAPSFGQRWRIPTGIAASVLAGVIGHQTWQDSLHEAPMSAPMASQVVVVTMPTQNAPPPPTDVQYVPEVVVAAQAPPPPPAAPAAPAAAVAAVKPALEFGMQGDLAKRAEAEPSPPPPVMADAAREVAAADSVAKPAPAAPAQAQADLARVVPPMAAAPAAPIVMAEEKAVVEPALAARARKADAALQPEPAVWLASIDGLLKARRNAEALAEWRKFKAAYPAHPVAAELEARIKALDK